MTPSKILFCLFLVLVSMALAPGDAAAQAVVEPKDGAVKAYYLAKDDGSGYVGDAAETFTTTDVPIYCVIEIRTPESTTVKMNFVAVTVPGVKTGTQIVSSSYTLKDGENMVTFKGSPRGSWTPGTYRVDIFVEGKLSAEREFEIIQKAVPAAQMRFVEGKSSPALNSRKQKPRP